MEADVLIRKSHAGVLSSILLRAALRYICHVIVEALLIQVPRKSEGQPRTYRHTAVCLAACPSVGLWSVHRLACGLSIDQPAACPSVGLRSAHRLA
jgi:hypothetical protein